MIAKAKQLLHRAVGRSIRRKLLWITTLTSTAVLLLACTMFFLYDQAAFRRSLVAQVGSVAQTIGHNCTAALAFNDKRAAERNLAALRLSPGVLSGAIYDDRGLLFAAYRQSASEPLPPPPPAPQRADFHRRTLHLSQPILLEGDLIGVIAVSHSLQPLTDRVRQYSVIALGIMAAALLLAFFLSLHLQHTVSAPLQRLAQVAARISQEKDYSVRAEATTQDEVGVLVKSLNQMLDTIQDRDERLMQSRQSLVRYQRQLRSLAQQLVVSEENERRQIATELHDSVAQLLWTARLKLDLMLREKTPAQPDAIHEARDLVDQVLSQVRLLTFRLSPPALYELGLQTAVSQLCQRARVSYGLAISFQDDTQGLAIRQKVALILFRSIQELLMNVYKHASATQAGVCLALDDEDHIIATIADDGKGFSPEALSNRSGGSGGGFGLFSIRERIDQAGGIMEIDSSPGNGTTITLVTPLEEEGTARGEDEEEEPVLN